MPQSRYNRSISTSNGISTNGYGNNISAVSPVGPMASPAYQSHQPRKFHSLSKPPTTSGGGSGGGEYAACPVTLHLDLSENNLSLEKISELFRHLPIQHVEKLTLTKNDLESASLGFLLDICRSLKHLNISGNARITGSSALRSLTATERRGHLYLQTLNLSGCNLADGVVLLGEMLADKRCRLKELDVSYSQMHDHGLANAFGRGVGRNCSLEKLTLQHCGLKDSLTDFVNAVGSASPSSLEITHWDLGRNNLSKQALRSLSGVLIKFYGNSNSSSSGSSAGASASSSAEYRRTREDGGNAGDNIMIRLTGLGLSETSFNSAEDAYFGQNLLKIRLSKSFKLDLSKARVKLCQRDINSNSRSSRGGGTSSNSTNGGGGGSSADSVSGSAGGNNSATASASEGLGALGVSAATLSNNKGTSSNSGFNTGSNQLSFLESLSKISYGDLVLDGLQFLDPGRGVSVACHPHIVKLLSATKGFFSFDFHPDPYHFVQFAKRRMNLTAPKKFSFSNTQLRDDNLKSLCGGVLRSVNANGSSKGGGGGGSGSSAAESPGEINGGNNGSNKNTITPLRELTLIRNGLTSASIDHLGMLIENNLIKLDLSHNKIRNSGAALLAKFIRNRISGMESAAVVIKSGSLLKVGRGTSSSAGTLNLLTAGVHNTAPPGGIGVRSGGRDGRGDMNRYNNSQNNNRDRSQENRNQDRSQSGGAVGSSPPYLVMSPRRREGSASGGSSGSLRKGEFQRHEVPFHWMSSPQTTIQLGGSDEEPGASGTSATSSSRPRPDTINTFSASAASATSGVVSSAGATSLYKSNSKFTLILAHCGIDTQGVCDLWSVSSPLYCDLLDVSGNHFNLADFFADVDPADPEMGWNRFDISDVSLPDMSRLHDWLATRIAVSREELFDKKGSGMGSSRGVSRGASRGPSPKQSGDEGGVFIGGGGLALRAGSSGKSGTNGNSTNGNNASSPFENVYGYPIRGSNSMEGLGNVSPSARSITTNTTPQQLFEWKRRKMIARALSGSGSSSSRNGANNGNGTLRRTASSRTPSQASPMSPQLSKMGMSSPSVSPTGIDSGADNRSPSPQGSPQWSPTGAQQQLMSAEQDLHWYRLMLTDPHVHPAYLCNHGSQLSGLKLRGCVDLCGEHLVEMILSQALGEMDLGRCGLWRDWRVFGHASCKSVFHWANRTLPSIKLNLANNQLHRAGINGQQTAPPPRYGVLATAERGSRIRDARDGRHNAPPEYRGGPRGGPVMSNSRQSLNSGTSGRFNPPSRRASSLAENARRMGASGNSSLAPSPWHTRADPDTGLQHPENGLFCKTDNRAGGMNRRGSGGGGRTHSHHYAEPLDRTILKRHGQNRADTAKMNLVHEYEMVDPDDDDDDPVPEQPLFSRTNQHHYRAPKSTTIVSSFNYRDEFNGNGNDGNNGSAKKLFPAEVLSGLRNAHQLKLPYYGEQDPKLWAAIAGAGVAHKWNSIQSVDLRGNQLDDRAAKWLSRIVLFGVKTIVLDDNHIGAEGLKCFLGRIVEKNELNGGNNGAIGPGLPGRDERLLLSMKGNNLAHPVAPVFTEFCKKMRGDVENLPCPERWDLRLDENRMMSQGDVVRILETVLQYSGVVKVMGLRGILSLGMRKKEGECLDAIINAAREGGTLVDLGASPGGRPNPPGGGGGIMEENKGRGPRGNDGGSSKRINNGGIIGLRSKGRSSRGGGQSSRGGGSVFTSMEVVELT